MPYNWEQPDWPQFRYDVAAVQDDLLAFAEKAGQVGGVLRGLPDGARTQAVLGLTKVSKATATRDLQDLVRKEILVPLGGGRSTRYELRL